MISYPRHVAVLTGDLVRSTDLAHPDIDRVMGVLADFASANEHWIGHHFTRQSGDGWQMLVLQPEHALRSALAIRARLRSEGKQLETYISIATGRLDEAPPSNLNLSNQTVFRTSGKEIQILKTHSEEDGVKIAHWDMGVAASVAVLADHISQRWTPPQAAAMLLFLDPYSDDISYTDAATSLGKSRQAVTKSLDAAGKDALLKALSFLEASLRGRANDGDKSP